MKFCSKCPVIGKKSIAAGIYDYLLYAPEIASAAKCGQFVNIRSEGHFLRRPISICGFDPKKGTLRLVFEVRGGGTRDIARINEGDIMDIVGPLGGKGFDLSGKTAVIVGGGIGTPPLLPIAEHYGSACTVITGFRSANAAILQRDFAATGAEVILCTDDGTAGRKGFVTEALDEVLSRTAPDIIYACGPMPMIKGVAKRGTERKIRTQVSLEERMGCGVGGCLVCVCPTIGEDGNMVYSHVCKNGPVFEAHELEL